MAPEKKQNGKAAAAVEETGANGLNGSSSSNANGTASKAATDAPAAATGDEAEKPAVEIARLGGGKPDPEHNRAQIDEIQKQIEKVQAELVSPSVPRQIWLFSNHLLILSSPLF